MTVEAGAKDIADSTHGVEALRVDGTVVADPTPVSYSPHPSTELQVPESVNPLPAVKVVVVETPSTFPTTNEFELGVKDPTLADVDPTVEVPVEEGTTDVEYPAISYIDSVPATTPPKVAVIVFDPEPEAVAYQMYE